MWQSIASRLWLCWAAADRPAPPAVVIVSGSLASPPNMYFSFAAWLTIWSAATQHEVHEHQVDDRAQPGDRGADAEADDRLLADRRVDDPALAELALQAVERVEHAAVRADVLAGDEHVGVGRHLQLDGLVERVRRR